MICLWCYSDLKFEGMSPPAALQHWLAIHCTPHGLLHKATPKLSTGAQQYTVEVKCAAIALGWNCWVLLSYHVLSFWDSITLDLHETVHHRPLGRSEDWHPDFYTCIRFTLRTSWDDGPLFTPLRCQFFSLEKASGSSESMRLADRERRIHHDWKSKVS